MKTKLFISVLAFLAIASLTNAQDKSESQAQEQQPVTPVTRGAYVDANNNGICDYYERPGAFYRYNRRIANIPAPGLRRGLPVGQGRGYGRGLGPGQGRGLGPGQGRGLAPGGRFYVDADKNGICDFYEQSVKK